MLHFLSHCLHEEYLNHWCLMDWGGLKEQPRLVDPVLSLNMKDIHVHEWSNDLFWENTIVVYIVVSRH